MTDRGLTDGIRKTRRSNEKFGATRERNSERRERRKEGRKLCSKYVIKSGNASKST